MHPGLYQFAICVLALWLWYYRSLWKIEQSDFARFKRRVIVMPDWLFSDDDD